MVFVQPSPADAVLGPLQEFTKNLDNYLRPNREFQIAMQKAISVNPGLAIQLSGLERNAPGSLQALGLGDLGKIISNIPESAANQFERENRGQILGNEKQKLQLEGEQQGFNLDRLNRTIDLLKNNPQVGRDEILKQLTGQTSDQAALTGAQVAETQASARKQSTEADIKQATAPGEIAKAQLEEESLNSTLKQYPHLSQIDPVALVSKMMNGGSIGPEFVNYLNLPGAQQAVAHAQTIAEMQAQRDNQMLLRLQMHQGIDATERANINNAATMVKQSKVGTIPAWRTVLEKPEEVLQVQDKLKKANGDLSALTQDERNVVTAATAQDHMQEDIRDKQNRADQYALMKSINEARLVITKNPTQAGADLALSPINSSLAEMAKRKGTEQYQAVWGAVPAVGQPMNKPEKKFGFFGEHTGLYYVDPNGVRVDDNVPFGITKPGPSQRSGAGLSNEAAQALAVLSGITDKSKRQASLNNLKQKRPDIYNQIITRLP